MLVRTVEEYRSRKVAGRGGRVVDVLTFFAGGGAESSSSESEYETRAMFALCSGIWSLYRPVRFAAGGGLWLGSPLGIIIELQSILP